MDISPGQFHGVRQVVINGKILDDCQANRSCLISWLQESQGETIQSITPAWFRKVMHKNPQFESQLAWVSAKSISREEFNQFGRLNGFSEADANWHLATSVLGKNFTEHQLGKAIDSGTLRLAKATAEELNERAQEQEEKRQIQERAVLLGNDQQAAREIAHRHSQQQREAAAQRQLEQQLVEGYEREVVFGGKQSPLPTTWNGQVLNDLAIRNASAEMLKSLFRRFGSAQVTARMHGIQSATGIIDRGDGKGPREVTCKF